MITQIRFLNSIPPEKKFMKGYKVLLLQSATIGIKVDGILLYSLLASRLKLSYQNKTKYSDEDGVFLYYASAQIEEELGWVRSKTDRAMKNLEACGLLKRKKEYDKHGVQRRTKLFLREWHPNLAKEDYPPLDPDKLLASYIMLPSAFFEEPVFSGLSNRAKILYCMILDKLSMSEKYERYDLEGHLYALYDAAKMAKELNCSLSSITRAMTALRDAGLAELDQTEYCSEWRVYLRDYREVAKRLQNEISQPVELENGVVENPAEPPVDNSSCGGIILQNGDTVSSYDDASLVKNDAAVSSNHAPINIASKPDEEVSPLEIASPRYRPLPPVVAETEELIDSFAPPWQVPTWKKILDQIEGVLRTDLVHGRPFVYGGGSHTYSTDELLSAYGRLNPAILFVTISKLVPLWYKAKNPERLVREALFRAAEWHGKEAKRFCCQNSLDFKGKTINDYLGALKQRGGHPS